jgi:plasmid stability protein
MARGEKDMKTAKITIENVDPTVIEKLKQRAAKEGFSGYTIMLGFYAEKLANEEIVLASDQRYIDIAQRTAGELEWISEVLTISILSGKLTSPLTDEAQRLIAEIRGGEADE